MYVCIYIYIYICVCIYIYIYIHIYNLRELFYDRNPGDARVKVGSERKAASRLRGQRPVYARSAISFGPFVRGDPPKLALPWGGLLRKSSSAVRGQSGKAPRGYANYAGDLMPRSSRK